MWVMLVGEFTMRFYSFGDDYPLLMVSKTSEMWWYIDGLVLWFPVSAIACCENYTPPVNEAVVKYDHCVAGVSLRDHWSYVMCAVGLKQLSNSLAWLSFHLMREGKLLSVPLLPHPSCSIYWCFENYMVLYVELSRACLFLVDHLEDVGADRRIILKYMWRKRSWRLCTRFMWSRIGSSTCLL